VVTCLCADNQHNQKPNRIVDLFTQKMIELLPNYEELKVILKNSITVQQLTLYDEPVQDLKPNRWITIQEQNSFCGFLRSIGINIDDLDWCADTWQKFRCSVDYSHARKTRYIACGKRGWCPRCSKAYASRRANIMYQWIKQNLSDRLDFDLKLNQIVLTLPEHLHDMDLKLFAKMIKKFMKSFGIDSFGYSIQTRHSQNPLAGRYVHAHVLSLSMRETDKRIIQNAYYFDVDKMREVWKEIIEDCTGSVIEGAVNLHTEYASILHDRNKVLHMLAYLYRYPIEDLFNVQIRKQSINYVQSPQFEKFDGILDHSSELKLVREKVMNLVDEKKPRIVWCGLLTSTKRKKLIKKILHNGLNETLDNPPNYTLQVDDDNKPGFRWKSMKEIEKEMDVRAKECRDCGSPYEEKPFDYGKYTGDNEPIF